MWRLRRTLSWSKPSRAFWTTRGWRSWPSRTDTSWGWRNSSSPRVRYTRLGIAILLITIKQSKKKNYTVFMYKYMNCNSYYSDKKLKGSNTCILYMKTNLWWTCCCLTSFSVGCYFFAIFYGIIKTQNFNCKKNLSLNSAIKIIIKN